MYQTRRGSVAAARRLDSAAAIRRRKSRSAHASQNRSTGEWQASWRGPTHRHGSAPASRCSQVAVCEAGLVRYLAAESSSERIPDAFDPDPRRRHWMEHFCEALPIGIEEARTVAPTGSVGGLVAPDELLSRVLLLRRATLPQVHTSELSSRASRGHEVAVDGPSKTVSFWSPLGFGDS